MEIVKGRPLNVKERLKKEVRVYDLLDELDIEYWRIDHEVAQTMEDCEEVDRILDAVICKNLFLCNRQKTKFYLLMMPGDKAFKTKELSAQIQSARLSFAPEEYMEKFLDITPGSVSVMGLMNGYGKSGATSGGCGCTGGRIPWMPSMYQYIQSEIADKRYFYYIPECSAS